MLQVKNGQVVNVRLPKTGRLSDGRKVSGYDRLIQSDSKIAQAEGWMPDVEKKPLYDPATEQLKFSHYEVLKTQVNAVYVAELIPEPTPDPLQVLQTKVSKLESDVSTLIAEKTV